MLAHGALLRKNFFSDEEIIAIVRDYHHAGLTGEEVALMDYAHKVSLMPSQVTQADIEGLRGFGLTDREILDCTLVCTVRSFFSKTLDALDAHPDEVYHELSPELVKALATGRPYS